MENKFNMTILDCLLHGKFSSAGDLGTHLILKESLCEATRASLMDSLRCDIPRCSKGSKILFHGVEPIHVKSALKATRAIVDCMADADEKLFLRFSTRTLLSIYVSLVNIPYDCFIKSLKYYTAYPLAFFLKNDLPPCPENIQGSYPFPGSNVIRSWMKVRLFSKSHYTRNLRFFWSLLQGVKRACEFADDSFIASTMLKHKNVLSQIDDTFTLMSDDYQFIDDQVEEFCQSNVEFFKGFNPELDRDYEISNSACWERTRSNGGARGEILDISNDVYDDMHRIAISSSVGTILHGMIEVSPGKVKELRGVRTPVWQELNTLLADRPKAMVAAILEPLKVRLITKGPAVDYFLSKSLQKELFRYLRKFPQFELIGDPLREDHIYRMMDREKFLEEKGMTFSHFVSGDYSAATDNLKITYTKLGLGAALARFESPLMRAYWNTLGEHEIHYPKKFGIECFDQKTGQLMGSPLSFPFLCLNNIVAYRLSLFDYLGEMIPFENLPCLVNGDDILFRTNPEHYELWKKRVASIGFDLSIGKNYIHEKVLTINSTCFQYKENRLIKVDFCNFGLLSGTSKLGGSRGEVRDKAVDLCDAYTRSVCGAQDKKLAHAKFLTRNRVDLQKITCRGRYNLFLPRVLGGFGFPINEGITYHVTRFQACLAKLIKKTCDTTVVGFKNDGVSNSVGLRETKNSKKLMVGPGPLREYERLYETGTVTSVNSSYLQDTVTKFFTTIGEKYNAEKLFPFRLKNKEIDLDVHQDLFRVVCDHSF